MHYRLSSGTDRLLRLHRTRLVGTASPVDGAGLVTVWEAAAGRESALPEEDYQRALQAARGCDLMVVLGSSLRITPACDLPTEALAHGGKLVIINLQRTQLDQVPPHTPKGT